MTTTFDCPASRAVFESSGSSLGKIAAEVSAVEAQTIAAIAMSRTAPAGAGGRKNNLGKNWRMGFEKSRSAGFLVKASIEPEPTFDGLGARPPEQDTPQKNDRRLAHPWRITQR